MDMLEAKELEELLTLLFKLEKHPDPKINRVAKSLFNLMTEVKYQRSQTTAD